MNPNATKWDIRQWDSHKQRLVTGLAMAAPVAFVLGFAPVWTWALLVVLVSLIGLWELEKLFFEESPPLPWRVLFFASALVTPALTLLHGSEGLLFSLVLSLFAGLSCLLFSSAQDTPGIHRLALSCLSWLYLPFALSHALLLGELYQGRLWIFFVLFVVFSSDAGAYYSGRHFGKHKLYERVSPKKTVEGSVGGLLMSLATGGVFALLLVEGMALWKVLLLSGCVSVVSQMGDLMESMIKRISGKKDSGTLLPGHGGFLDRLDSLVFAFPFAWFFLSWMAH